MEAPGAQLTLGRLVEQLGGLLDVVAAPLGLDVTVAHTVIHDSAESLHADAGDVVLAVGVRPTDSGAAAVVRAAGVACASAIVIKSDVAIGPELVDVATSAGVAILSVTPAMSWSQLHTFMRTASVSSGHPPDTSLGGAPLGDLFALANAVSAMVGGPVTIEDPRSKVLAYSAISSEIDEPRRQTILDRRVPEEWINLLHETGVFKRLWSGNEVVRIDGLGAAGALRPRLAIAVKAGDEILGSIWVAQGDSPFTDEAEVALRQAADLAALHIVRSRAGEDVERRLRGEHLRAILEGRGPLDVLANRLSVELEASYATVAFELQSNRDIEIVQQRERALDLVALYCDAYRRRVASVAIGHTIYSLVPLAADADLDSLRRLAKDIVSRSAEALAVELRVGLGSVVQHLRDAGRSRAEADQVLRVLARPGDERRIASIDEVRAEAMLLELRDIARDRPSLLIGKIDELVAHDAEHGSDYVSTLREYFDAFGNIPEAAAKLEVHPNTFRYRLRRIGELVGLDLDDPDQRLAAELQLKLR